jgi:hypothetical protein
MATGDNEPVSMEDDEPELAGYVPSDGRPLRSRRGLMVMRVLVVIGLLALVLPGVITTFSVASETAREGCKLWVAYADPSSPGSNAVFEVFGGHGIGWQCYTRGAFGGDRFIASLGFIPGRPDIPTQPVISS